MLTGRDPGSSNSMCKQFDLTIFSLKCSNQRGSAPNGRFFVKMGAEVRVGGDARLGSVTGEWIKKEA